MMVSISSVRDIYHPESPTQNTDGIIITDKQRSRLEAMQSSLSMEIDDDSRRFLISSIVEYINEQFSSKHVRETIQARYFPGLLTE